MYAIEFKVKIENGMIKIPQKYREKIKDIVLTEEKEVSTISINLIDRLMKSPIKIEKFTPLSREEIHERN